MDTILLYFKSIIFKFLTYHYECKEQKTGLCMEGGALGSEDHLWLTPPLSKTNRRFSKLVLEVWDTMFLCITYGLKVLGFCSFSSATKGLQILLSLLSLFSTLRGNGRFRGKEYS